MVLNNRGLILPTPIEKSPVPADNSGMIFLSQNPQKMNSFAVFMNRSAFYFILFTLGLTLSAPITMRAQTDSLKMALSGLGTSPAERGKVEFQADSAITSLEKSSRKFREIKGYRIQIFLGGLDQVKSERNKYLALGLPYSVYQKQIVPEQALQVGDFINRMEMEKHLEIIRKYYPKAFGVVEIIEPPKYTRPKKR